MNVRDEVASIVSSLFFSGKNENLQDDDSFMESGDIDSLGMMELVSSLEKKFGFKVDVNDLLPKNFDSIEAITQYIKSRE